MDTRKVIFNLINANCKKINMLLKKRKLYKLMIVSSKRKIKQYSLLLSGGIKKRRVWSIVENSLFWEVEVPKFSEERFKNTFRVSRSTFAHLEKKLFRLEKMDTIYRLAIPLRKRIAIALYALGSSAEYRTVASLFGVGRTTVGELVLSVCHEITKVFERETFNAYPPSDEKIKDIVSGFEKLGFPQCYGAIDGCHIEVNVPKDEASDYYNFKGWHSTILFAAVDYRYRFTYINVGTPGRCSDSTIFEQSKLKYAHESDQLFKKYSKCIGGTQVPILLIGDSAFKLSTVVLKPYPFAVNQSELEKLFNFRLSRCRRVVENAFGHLKARFRKLGRGLEVNIANTNVIIKTCCILHNICNERNDAINKMWLQETEKKAIETTAGTKFFEQKG